jgi:two-component system, NarL family, capsular synthesis sensor histidine kinase RcsC
MTMPEPVQHKNLTGQRDISALERHQRHLLYGGGAFLSVIILLIMAASILLSIRDYKSDQLDNFRKAKMALDSAFVQRDAGYIRTLNMIEYVWKNKSDELAKKGNEDFSGFISHDNEAVIRSNGDGVPWLVLGRDVDTLPKQKVERYLGLIREMSIISSTSLTIRSDQGGGRPSTAVNFYDPSEMLFAFGVDAKATGLDAVAQHGNRADLFDKLVVPSVDFRDIHMLKDMRQGNPRLSFYGKGLPRILTSFGKNPLTGEPAILGTLVAMDGDEPIGAFVAYEPVEPFLDQIRRVSPFDVTIVTDDGKVVFGTGSAAHSETVAAAISSILMLQASENDVTTYRKGGRFFIAERVAGTSWALVRTYTWTDILQGEAVPMLVAIILAILLLGALWLLLIRQDRSIFAPVLARAKQVYQSEVLNRTMIETSPVGLCVIATSNAAPLLQNDLVRDYASGIPDPDITFYRQLLQDFAEAESTLSGRPDAREFNFVLHGDAAEAPRHLLVAAMPIIYQDRHAIFCVLRDVTARIEIEENLRRARRDSEDARLAAESANRAKTSFVAMMSHEIRTPLNGILGHLELLGRSRLAPEQRERLGRIRISADALLSIISDVLDFSRIEAGQLDIDPIPFELRPLIEQTALLYAPAAQRKGLKLYYGVEPGLASVYRADGHRVRQILNNLVSNAVKFTESGRIILRVRQVPAKAGESVRLRFEVIDSGIGMTEQQRQQVFQPFSQADASISRRFGGSGLGLTLCQQLSELMGGGINVQSTLSVGSVFSLEVPVSIDARAQAEDSSRLQGQRIALLSAAAEWRNEISALLTGWGAEVMMAALPSELDPDWIEQCDVLVIFGTRHVWLDDEEQSLVTRARRVVKAIADGPLLPELRDHVRFVSCYSSKALLAAILDAESEADGHAPDVLRYRRDRQALPQHSVLLVDDNLVNRELIQQQLETLGYKVDTAEDGIAALRLWQDGRYGAVLTDINMPNMNGYELTQRLRAQGVTVPILAVTATALASEKVHCKRAGINDLLLKPLSLECLGEAMQRHLHLDAPLPAPHSRPAWVGKYPEKVSRVFVESGTRDLHAILEAADAQDQEALLARIHSMKGALLMLGEQEVAAQCSALEKRVDAEGIHAAHADLGQLEAAMRRLLQSYAELL